MTLDANCTTDTTIKRAERLHARRQGPHDHGRRPLRGGVRRRGRPERRRHDERQEPQDRRRSAPSNNCVVPSTASPSWARAARSRTSRSPTRGRRPAVRSGRAIVVEHRRGDPAVRRDREQHRLELQQERDRRARQRRRKIVGNTVTGSASDYDHPERHRRPEGCVRAGHWSDTRPPRSGNDVTANAQRKGRLRDPCPGRYRQHEQEERDDRQPTNFLNEGDTSSARTAPAPKNERSRGAPPTLTLRQDNDAHEARRLELVTLSLGS